MAAVPTGVLAVSNAQIEVVEQLHHARGSKLPGELPSAQVSIHLSAQPWKGFCEAHHAVEFLAILLLAILGVVDRLCSSGGILTTCEHLR